MVKKRKLVKKHLRKIYSTLTIVLALLILYISISPAYPVSETVGISHLDKVKHLLAYFLLAGLTYKSIGNKKMAITVAGTFGLLIELIQLPLTTRTFSLLDIIANYSGASLVLILTPLENKIPILNRF